VHLGAKAKIYLLDSSPALIGACPEHDRDNTGGPELLVNPNPTFEWVRLTQRIPVRIHIDEVPERVLISSGMTWRVSSKRRNPQLAVLAALRGWRAAARL
jgi:multidrug resistance efflux pump